MFASLMLVQYDVTAVLTSVTLQASLTAFLTLVSLLMRLVSLTSPLLIKSFQLIIPVAAADVLFC
jgi:hypothetical protein